MDNIINLLEERFEFGRRKYNQGVSIDSDMSTYTLSKEDSYIDMQIEEILDGLIYTSASKLRYLKQIGKYNNSNLEDDNKNIIIQIFSNKNNENEDYNINQYNLILNNLLNILTLSINLKKKINK